MTILLEVLILPILHLKNYKKFRLLHLLVLHLPTIEHKEDEANFNYLSSRLVKLVIV